MLKGTEAPIFGQVEQQHVLLKVSPGKRVHPPYAVVIVSCNAAAAAVAAVTAAAARVIK